MSEQNAPTPADGPSPIGEISQEPSAFEAFLDKNQRNILILGIVGLLGVVGYVIVDGIRNSKLQAAASAVSSASTVPEYEAAAKEFEGTNAGGTALMRKAQLQWRDQQRDEAVATLDTFLSNYSEHPAYGAALTMMGTFQRDLGKAAEAKDFLQQAADSGGPTSSHALLYLGDIALLEKDMDSAKAFYQKILVDYDESHPQIEAQARQRIKLVGVNPPAEAVAKETPASPVTPTAATDPIKVSPNIVPNAPVATPQIPVDPTPDLPQPGPAPLQPTTPADTNPAQ